MTDTSVPGRIGFSLEDLAQVLVPSSPVLLGNRVVYALRRTDITQKKSQSSLWAVALSGAGEPARLTQGAWLDRLPRAEPGGRFLLFVSDRGFGDQLYRLEATGGDARRLTALPRGSISDFTLSPDGNRVALVLTPAAPDDDALPLAADLARVEPENTPLEAPPAPDIEPEPPKDDRGLPRARVIARLRNREDGIGWSGGARAHLWIADAATGHSRRVTRGPRDFSAPAWAPSGDALVATATRLDPEGDPDRDSLRNELVRIDLGTGSVERIEKPQGAALAPSVSPRGDLVAYTMVGPDDPFCTDNVVLWVSSLREGQPPRALTAELDRPVMDMAIDDLAGGTFVPTPPIWSSDSGSVTVVVTDRGSVRLFTQPLDGRPGAYRTPEERAVSSPAPAPEGAFLAIVADRGRFAEIGRVAAHGSITLLTAHNSALAARVTPRAPELVQIERDGAVVSGYYLSPRNVAPGSRVPAILYVHGGPHVCYGERLFFEMQWLADSGYGVFYGNPRGSHSYGERFSRAIHFHWGEPDAADQLAFADWLGSRPEIDPSRMGVAGGSYGGFMTLLLSSQTDLFRAAVAQRGLYDWATSVGASDYGHETARFFDGVWPWHDPARYLAQSPIRSVDRVRTPMLVVHNEGDLRAGMNQALELFIALKLSGVPTGLVLFPEECHGMSRSGRIDRRLERLRQIRAWFDAWL